MGRTGFANGDICVGGVRSLCCYVILQMGLVDIDRESGFSCDGRDGGVFTWGTGLRGYSKAGSSYVTDSYPRRSWSVDRC